MGNKASSISKTNIQNKIINSIDLNAYCETVNETAINTANEVYISHTASAYAKNEMNIDKITISGKDTKADLKLSNTGQVKMTSEMITDITNSVSNSISSTMIADIKEMIDTDLLNKLTEEMNQNIKNGMLSTAFGNENNTNQETNIENNIENKTNLSFENIVKNITNYNMTNNIEEQCMANSKSENQLNVNSIEVSDGGELKFNLENDIDVKLDCISNIKLINNIASNLCNLANIKVEEEKKTKTDNDIDKKTTQTVENEGFGGALGNIIGNFGEAVSSVFKSSTLIVFIIGCVVCIVLIVAVFGIAYILTDETGSQSVQGLAATISSNVGPGGKMKMLTGKGNNSSTDKLFKSSLKKLFNNNEL